MSEKTKREHYQAPALYTWGSVAEITHGGECGDGDTIGGDDECT